VWIPRVRAVTQVGQHRTTRPIAWPAHVTTGLRVLLTPVFAWCILQPGGGRIGVLTGVLFVCIAASDVLDGRFARAYGRPSAFGRIFDPVADIFFLLTSLLALVARGLVPWWVPASIAVAFASYVVDAWWGRTNTSARARLARRVGHLGGMLNYGLVGLAVAHVSLRWPLISRGLLDGACVVVPVYSLAAPFLRFAGRRGLRVGGQSSVAEFFPRVAALDEHAVEKKDADQNRADVVGNAKDQNGDHRGFEGDPETGEDSGH